MLQWEIGLDAYQIQDGSHEEFFSGQEVAFPLACFLYEPKILSGQSLKTAHFIGFGQYEIDGKVIYCNGDFGVIDFGLLAAVKLEKGMDNGCRVQSRIYLGTDDDYRELATKMPDLPPLIYSWRINSISMQTAPFIEVISETGNRTLVRDKSQFGYHALERTNTWEDDGGNALYYLTCTKI